MGCCCHGTCKCGAAGSSALGSTLSLNISGVNVPTGCLQAEFFSNCGFDCGEPAAYRFSSFPINGTFCLTKDPNSCSWSVIVPVVVDVWFGASACGAYGAGHFTYTQLKITATEVYAPGVGAQMVVSASVVDASKDWVTAFGGCPVWDGFNPFDLIILSKYGILGCSGTVTLHNDGTPIFSPPGTVSVWWNVYENLLFESTGCQLIQVRNSWVSSNDPPPPPTGTPWGGLLVLSDSAC